MCAAWRYDVCPMVPVIDLPVVFVHGIGSMEIIDENIQFVLYRKLVAANQVVERKPEIMLIRPLITLPETIEQTS